MFSSNRMLDFKISSLALLFLLFLERTCFSFSDCLVLQHLTIADLLFKAIELFFRACHEVLVKLKFLGILLQLGDELDLPADCLELDGPVGEGEWRLLLSLLFLFGIVLLFLLGVFDLNFRIVADGVFLEHLEDFAGLQVTLHLS